MSEDNLQASLETRWLDPVPDWAKHPRSLLEIGNATQALYLGLPPWYEVWQARLDARRRKKQQTGGNTAAANAAGARGIANPEQNGLRSS